MERFTAGASVLRVRVVNREALTLDRVKEVDLRTTQIRHGHAVNNDLDTVKVADGVALKDALVKVERVNQTRASAR